MDFSDFIDSIESLGRNLTDAFSAFFGDIDLTTPEGLSQAMQKIVDSVAALTNVTSGIIAAWEPFIEVLGLAVDKFADADASTTEITGKILGFGQAINKVFDNIGLLTGALNILTIPLSVIAGKHAISAIASFKGLGTAITGILPAIGRSVGVVSAGAASLSGFGASVSGVLPALGQFAGVVGSAAAGWQFGTALRGWIPSIDTVTQKVIGLTDKVFNWTGTQRQAAVDMDEVNKKWAAAQERMAALNQTIEETPEHKTIDVETEGEIEAAETLQQFEALVGDIPDEKVITAKAEVDTGTFEKIEDVIIEYVPDSQEVIIRTATDDQAIEKSLSEIDQKIPHERLLEIRLQGDYDVELANIKGKFDLMQTSVEWTARLKTAEFEADAEVAQAVIESLSTGLESTGDVLSTIFDKFGELSVSDQVSLERYLDRELNIQRDLVDQQAALTEAQVEFINAKTEALERGDSLITIDGTNLEPELEAFMLRILQNIQIWANTEGQEFLLGVS